MPINKVLSKKQFEYDVARIRVLVDGASSSPAGTFNLNRIFVFPVTNSPPTQYIKTAANLAAALLSAGSGQIVLINGPCTLTGNFSVPPGVMLAALSRYEVDLIGTVTINNLSSIYNLKTAAAANDANPLYGVLGPTTGTGYILNCDISAIQAGAGNAYAVGAVNGLTVNDGNLDIRYSSLYGESTSGDGYAGRSTRGVIYSRWCQEFGSTDRWMQT